MNNFSQDGNNYYQPAPNNQMNQFPPYSNILLVDSLEQALRMPTRNHSEMAYWDRYQDNIYRVYTDNYGNKQYMVLDVKIHKTVKEDASEPATMELLLSKLQKLEKGMEELHEKHNLNTDVSTNTTDSSK